MFVPRSELAEQDVRRIRIRRHSGIPGPIRLARSAGKDGRKEARPLVIPKNHSTTSFPIDSDGQDTTPRAHVEARTPRSAQRNGCRWHTERESRQRTGEGLRWRQHLRRSEPRPGKRKEPWRGLFLPGYGRCLQLERLPSVDFSQKVGDSPFCFLSWAT